MSFIFGAGFLLAFVFGCEPLKHASIGHAKHAKQVDPATQRKDEPSSKLKPPLTEKDREYMRLFTEQTGRALEVERRGDAAVLLNRYDEAERLYRQAISMSPKFEDSESVVSMAPKKLALMFLYRNMWIDVVDTITKQTKHGEMLQIHPIACIAYVELGDVNRARACAPNRIGSYTFDPYPEELPPPPTTPAEWKAASYFSIAVDVQGADEPFKLYADYFFAQAANAYPEIVPYTFEYAVFLWSRGYLLEARDWFQTARRNTKGPLGERIDNIVSNELDYPISKKRYKTR
ncbi:MAG: hypothetical protein KIS64_10535 [Fimbriimonadaceae bacterium]|nr:hypothetical protein [Fimbriimonadaceae bacterium]